MILNRSDFQNLTKIRLKETKTLLKNENFNGAYYLSGYVIECALKSCIAKKTKKYDFPPDKNTINNIYQHRLGNLIKVADLQLQSEIEKNDEFKNFWEVVEKWNSESRYEIHNEQEAKDLYNSIVNKKNGVLKWIRQYW